MLSISNVANDDDKKVQLGNVEYEVVDQFCCYVLWYLFVDIGLYKLCLM